MSIVIPSLKYLPNGAISSGDFTIQKTSTTAFRVRTDAGATTIFTVDTSAPNVLIGSGSLFIADTTNANMTTGLTINQGAADNEILALKSSDIAHGLTSITETDTYFFVKKVNATAGGTEFRSQVAAPTVSPAFLFEGATTGDTAKSTAGRAGYEFNI